MLENRLPTLTERQRNELEYHRERALQNQGILDEPFSFDVLEDPDSRWWNAYWHMYSYLLRLNPKGQRVLVVGCGFGEDALRLAKLGARVHAFDLSPESLEIAKTLARKEGLDIVFGNMPAEAMEYESDFFDTVVARDILHHVDIPEAIREIRRVTRPGGRLVMNEIYSNSATKRVRNSRLVESYLYPPMQRFVYGEGKPYITADERKLDETDILAITAILQETDYLEYFNFLVGRIAPVGCVPLAIVDRMLLVPLRPLGPMLAGRILLSGIVAK
jgi:ubiquinone/menaquinone biosynthesis C-methylase UbiE